MIRKLACLLLLVALAPGTFVRDPQRPPNLSQTIRFQAVEFVQGKPKSRAAGALEFLAGWEMTSANDQFGGFSGLANRATGGFLALSDAGILMGFTPPGLPRTAPDFIAQLPSITGSELSKGEKDSESITLDPVSGRYWVGFEYANAVARYSPGMVRVEKRIRPAAMQRWTRNGGPEAFVRLANGHFVMLEENARDDGTVDGLYFAGDPVDGTKPIAFRYAPPSGYLPTDAAALPDGRVLILHRRLSFPDGFTAALSIADPARIRHGRTWKAKVISRLKPPVTIDNMEGLAITPSDEGPEYPILWMISDDNYAQLQRTLLLAFRLDLKAVNAR